MKKSDVIRGYVLANVGAPYIYGATGARCTPAYRRARQKQYPLYATSIEKYCPVLSQNQPSCDGCKYKDRAAFDCAQLTRLAAKAAGISIPSGATSQWNADVWAIKGIIDHLPRGRVAFLFRQTPDGKMQHTATYLGDGTFIDARGHYAGVLHSALDTYKWTHFAILRGQEEAYVPAPPAPAQQPAPPKPSADQGVLQVVKGQPLMRGAAVTEIQKRLIALGYSVGVKGADGVYGHDTAEAVRRFQRDAGLTADGIVGASTRAALLSSAPAPQYIVTIGPVSAAKRDELLKAYPQARAEQMKEGRNPAP